MPLWKNLVRHLGRVPDQVVIEEPTPVEPEKEPWEYEDPYFALGIDFTVDVERIREEERRHQERVVRIWENYSPGEKKLPLRRQPGEPYSAVYTFENREGPIAPYSAVLVPRPLTRIEQEALAIADMLDGVQVKSALKKKVKDLKKGPRRVIVQPNGKLKEVKGAA